MNHEQPALNERYDIIIVGAGAAGIGTGIVLQDLGIAQYVIIERDSVGASFKRWPEEMRFITPSFPGNAFGMLDLNAVAIGTSPACTLNREHPSGPQYAEYLQVVAAHFRLPIVTGIDVTNVRAIDDGFLVETNQGDREARFVIWAAGEFQYPRTNPFPGAEHGRNTASVGSWDALDGDAFSIIGGYESGMDAAYHLTQRGKRVQIFDAAPSWDTGSGDPSLALSPYTRERLGTALASGRLALHFDTPVVALEPDPAGVAIIAESGQRIVSATPPLLATGFRGSLRLIGDHFAWDERGNAILTAHDESTRSAGLFVVGPLVRHPGAIFCFIYKFRQRFAVVAATIAARMGVSVEPLERYYDNTMFLEDLSCCDEGCTC